MTADRRPVEATAAPTVLLVDDDADALVELEEILELEDVVSTTASDCDAAFHALDTWPDIRVVVTDVHLVRPDGQVENGVELVSAARARFSDRHLAFIVLSGDADAVSSSIETGAVDFLTKPLLPENLVSAVHAAKSKLRTELDSGHEDIEAVLKRKVEETTRSLQRVTSDLAERERQLSQSKEAYQRQRVHGGKLRHALRAGQIVPWFQPQICVRSGRLLGFEALARWQDPNGTVHSPADFLDLAAEIGLMKELDGSLQAQTFDAIAAFHRSGLQDCQVGINLTAEQLADQSCIDTLCLQIESAGLDMPAVSIEVLESAMLDDAAADPIKANLERVARLGLGIELDDFGTGHAGLSSLRDLDVTRIKIDRSFVQNVHVDGKLQKFTRALIGLAKALDVEVLAEGVESEDEFAWLMQHGCDAIQGFWVARPMPADQALAWALNHKAKSEEVICTNSHMPAPLHILAR